MASAMDKQPAPAGLSAVAAAGCLPTATRGSQSSYTTLWDTTLERVHGRGPGMVEMAQLRVVPIEFEPSSVLEAEHHPAFPDGGATRGRGDRHDLRAAGGR